MNSRVPQRFEQLSHHRNQALHLPVLTAGTSVADLNKFLVPALAQVEANLAAGHVAEPNEATTETSSAPIEPALTVDVTMIATSRANEGLRSRVNQKFEI